VVARPERGETGRRSGPLAGVRVLDLTTVLLGPYATQILGDMGADVIKVEAPAGDPLRAVGPARHAGMGAVFLNANRNKRSLALDLKNPAARRALLRVAESADVFVHSMRPQAIARLGLAYEDVAAVNPRIVYCGAYGYSKDGPYGHLPAYDDMIQGASGLAALQGRPDGRPRYAATVIADKTVGLSVVYAVAMALFHRERTGEGQAVEVPMFETMVSFLMVEHLYGLTFDPPEGGTGYQRILSPDRRPYATVDGYVCVLPYTDRQWASFFEIVGRPDLARDDRFADLSGRTRNVDALYAALAEILATRTTHEWLTAFEAAAIPAMKVNEPDDLPADPHLAATGFFRTVEHPTEGRLRTAGIPVSMSATPGGIDRPAPRLGEHGREVLAEAGCGDDEIAALAAAGVLVEPR